MYYYRAVCILYRRHVYTSLPWLTYVYIHPMHVLSYIFLTLLSLPLPLYTPLPPYIHASIGPWRLLWRDRVYEPRVQQDQGRRGGGGEGERETGTCVGFVYLKFMCMEYLCICKGPVCIWIVWIYSILVNMARIWVLLVHTYTHYVYTHVLIHIPMYIHVI